MKNIKNLDVIGDLFCENKFKVENIDLLNQAGSLSSPETKLAGKYVHKIQAQG